MTVGLGNPKSVGGVWAGSDSNPSITALPATPIHSTAETPTGLTSKTRQPLHHTSTIPKS
ncbi:MAG: hypothetical protein UHP27_09120 [Muribaculaceae bacterium]|nr:hypothetical protein [Muribaculaceae bacterium]